MLKHRCTSILPLTALFLITACGDQSSPLAPDPQATPPIDLTITPDFTETITGDGFLRATTDAPDDVDYVGTATVEMALSSQVEGGGGLDVVFADR